jgi:hypothetical protein
LDVTIRTFQPGDESAQVAIYNEAAAELPRFKPATFIEVKRRTSARDFDPGMRFFALADGRPVGYAVFNANGRVSYPWCCRGHEALAAPLFARVLSAMQDRGMRQAFAAYRADWPAVADFFLANGFVRARDMVNFVTEIAEMPTAPARRSSAITPLERRDVSTVLALAPDIVRVRTPEELARHLFQNPYFGSDALFALRSRTDDSVVAVGILIAEPTYADPKQVDSAMPCFRCGAFGTEGMQVKRIRGVFSFLARGDQNLHALGLDLLGHAALRLGEDEDIGSLAAQVPSDAPHLLKFYERTFRRQGSFPVFERSL